MDSNPRPPRSRQFVAALALITIALPIAYWSNQTPLPPEQPAQAILQASSEPARPFPTTPDPIAAHPPTRAEPQGEPSSGDHVITEQVVTFSRPFEAVAADYEQGLLANGYDFPLPEGVTAKLFFKRVRRFGETKGTLSGTVDNDPFSLAILSWADGHLSGTIRIPDQQAVYEIRSAGPGLAYYTKVDPSKFPPCAVGTQTASVQ